MTKYHFQYHNTKLFSNQGESKENAWANVSEVVGVCILDSPRRLEKQLCVVEVCVP